MKSEGLLVFAFIVAAVTLSANKTVSTGPYVDTVLADNPSGYWRLEEGAGVAVDSSPVGGTNDGTYINPAGTLPGAIPTEASNIAYHRANANDYIRISNTFTGIDNVLITSALSSP